MDRDRTMRRYAQRERMHQQRERGRRLDPQRCQCGRLRQDGGDGAILHECFDQAGDVDQAGGLVAVERAMRDRKHLQPIDRTIQRCLCRRREVARLRPDESDAT